MLPVDLRHIASDRCEIRRLTVGLAGARPKNQNTVLITQSQHDQEIGTGARLAATSRIAAHRSAIKLDFSIIP